MPAEIWPQPILDLLVTGGTRPVFEDGDRVVTAVEMASLVRRSAAGLRSAGVAPGVGVTLEVGVSPEALAVILAAFTLGARVSGIRPGLVASQRVVSGLLVDDAHAVTLASETDDGRALIAAGRADDPARITWTSGSTGTPKGCVRTYAAMSAAWAPYPDRWPPAIVDLAGRLDRFLVFGSLNSLVMLEYATLALTAGGVLVAARPPGFPGMVARHRATASVITVGKLHRLVRDQVADPADLGSLRALMVSGSPLEPARLTEALDVLGPVVFHGYGQTETGMIAMVTPAELLADPRALASVGRPPSVVELAVRGGGELFVRTPSQASAYWDDPAETAEVFDDGWVRTRDLARIDGRGYLHLIGRARDIVIVNAEVVYAGPVERVLGSDPAVAEAYVVGRPDEATGEAVHAFVVPATGHTPDPERLRTLVGEALGPAAVPASLRVIEAVPVGASGKPDKNAIDLHD